MPDYLHALPSGHRLDEYELVRVLGSGGFGITYLGYDHHLDKAVAIKEYLPNDLAVRADHHSVLPKSTEDKADYEWGLARFLNEAQTLARFDHRQIIKVHRFFRAHGTGYIVMEYAEGETLSEVLQRKGTLTETELQALLFPILDGLAVVHEADVLHRDIKPGNIVLRDDGSPVLIDFGSARQAVAGKSRSVTAIVTPGYAPIEQYSALLNAIDRSLKVDEGERPQSVAAWRAVLSNKTAAAPIAKNEGAAKSTAASSSSPSPSPGRKDRPLSKLLLAGLVVVIVLLFGVSVWQEEEDLGFNLFIVLVVPVMAGVFLFLLFVFIAVLRGIFKLIFRLILFLIEL